MAAETLLTEALGLLRTWGDAGTESDILCELADLASRRGDLVAARACLAASLERWWQLGAHGRIVIWLTALAERCATVAPTETLRLLGGLHTLVDHWQLSLSDEDLFTLIASLRDRLGPAAAAAWADGVTTDPAAITAFATAMIVRRAEAQLQQRAPQND